MRILIAILLMAAMVSVAVADEIEDLASAGLCADILNKTRDGNVICRNTDWLDCALLNPSAKAAKAAGKPCSEFTIEDVFIYLCNNTVTLDNTHFTANARSDALLIMNAVSGARQGVVKGVADMPEKIKIP